MTPLLMFLSQLSVRGKPLRLSGLSDISFFFLMECGGDHSGKYILLSTIGLGVGLLHGAAKHVQSCQMCLKVCPDGTKLPVLGSISDRQVKSNSRTGRDPEIQGSL